ncbi:hypothetical protein Halru_2033 [Halovivax ruber XH-70]|uniref:Uncharacterized protein n=1 Tax=Halovivax ruber (strain DSM 18193 / JCM 13892 / XH-70) TaxID=797302 RepID=L0IF71_HALRX|nr:hypothetical protein [Halovivax ruber]AGB16627.1 hypothetical protein Halru_2033 [Halovivax ruber XH-70]
MTELEIPPDADEPTAASLVRDFVDEGVLVEVHTADTMGHSVSESPTVEGEVTGFEPGYLELDGEGPTGKGVRWDEVSLLTRIET